MGKAYDRVMESRKELTKQLISEMSQGELCWIKGWNSTGKRPYNPITKAVYKGGNRFRLMLAAHLEQYTDNRWVTFAQAKEKDWAAAARVNGITPEMVKDAPYPHDLIPKVKGIFEAADLLIAYNNQFDLSFLRRWGISDSGKEQYDVMLEFAQEYGEWNEYFGDYKWQKLSTAASYYGYKFKAHDSLEDVRATLYVYKKLQAQESEL